MYTVYRMVWLPTRHFYVGVTGDPVQRLKQHRSDLRRGKHKSPLQAAFKLDPDTDKFVMEPVSTGLTKDEAYSLEEELIRKHVNNPRIVNDALGRAYTESMLEARKGFRHTEEAKRKISESQKGLATGRVASEETRRKMSDVRKGRKRTWETMNDTTKEKLRDTSVNKQITNGTYTWRSIAEAGRQLGVDRTTVMRWVRKGTNNFKEIDQ